MPLALELGHPHLTVSLMELMGPPGSVFLALHQSGVPP